MSEAKENYMTDAERIKELENLLQFKEKCLADSIKYREGYTDGIRDVVITLIRELTEK